MYNYVCVWGGRGVFYDYIFLKMKVDTLNVYLYDYIRIDLF